MSRKKKGIWGRVRPALDWFPLTSAGLVVTLASLVALLHFGLARQDLMLKVVGAAGLGLVGVSAIVTLLPALLLRRAVAKRPSDPHQLRLECGFAARTGFQLSTLWYVPFLYYTWKWTRPSAEVRTVERDGAFFEEVRPRRRGVYKLVRRRFHLRDIFGLASVRFDVDESRSVRFVPSAGNLRRLEVVRTMSGGEDLSHPEGDAQGDRIDFRHYAPGDPIRFVLWKVFAKTRELIVRTPEVAISPQRQTMAYLITGQGDEPAAGVARVAVDGGALGAEWVLGADGIGEPAETREDALELLARSAATPEEQAGKGLVEFLRKASTGKVRRAVVFVPAFPGPWLKGVAKAARSLGSTSRLEFVVCADGVVREVRKSRMRRFLQRQGDGETDAVSDAVATLAEVDEVVRALQSGRNRVMVIDRQAGKVFGSSHLEAMRRAAA